MEIIYTVLGAIACIVLVISVDAGITKLFGEKSIMQKIILRCRFLMKTGYSDDGPAWIGYVKTSKTKKTIYFNDHAFRNIMVVIQTIWILKTEMNIGFLD